MSIKRQSKNIVKKESQNIILTKVKRDRNANNLVKKNKILKVASKLFLKYGYKKTSLQMIVQQTGGSFATIYKLFGNKEDLFQKVIEFDGNNFIETLKKIFIQNINANSNLEKYFYDIGLCLIHEILKVDNIAFLRLMILEGYNNPKFVEVFNRYSNEIESMVAKSIKHYKDEYKQVLEMEEKVLKEYARIFIHLVIDPYWLLPLMDSNYQLPTKEEIKYNLERAIKIFMLYLKHYSKEI